MTTELTTAGSLSEFDRDIAVTRDRVGVLRQCSPHRVAEERELEAPVGWAPTVELSAHVRAKPAPLPR